MKDYDYIVVGSGITGLTAARILGQHGKRVLLLEKATILGGSLARFRVEGIPYDVGFHFTGGFTDDRNGVLDVMLSLLGVREQIHPIYFPREASHRLIFPDTGVRYDVPCGMEIVHEKLKRDFPKSRDGLEKYYEHFRNVVDGTPTLHVSGFDVYPPPIEEDRFTLQSFLDEQVPDPLLQTILAALCLCYGTKPRDVSFASHCRVCYGLQETLARVEDGGDAFVDALVAALRNDAVDIRTRTTIAQVADVENRTAKRFVLTDGSEVSAKACVFTIHPREILNVLPKEKLSKAFCERVDDFQESNGFFTLYAKMDKLKEPGAATLASILPGVDLNEMLTCRSPVPKDGPMMVLRSNEKANDGLVHTVTALEVSFNETTNPWFGTKLKRRPPEYYEYKNERTASVVGRMEKHIPECRGVKVIDSASSLTYRDYLHSPDGSAYGIQQKMGQLNVNGRLPIGNLYAAGQSALLPGVIGAMTSAFFACRSLLGREVFREYISGKPCCSSAL